MILLRNSCLNPPPQRSVTAADHLISRLFAKLTKSAFIATYAKLETSQRIVVQNDIQQALADGNPSGVVNETELTEAVHEIAHT